MNLKYWLFITTIALCPLLIKCFAQPLKLESSILGEQMEIWVRLQDNYHRTTTHFPVLYVLDADGLFNIAGDINAYLSNEFVDYMPSIR